MATFSLFLGIYLVLVIALDKHSLAYPRSLGSIIFPTNDGSSGIPTVKDVSAMCSVERGSITASIEFDRPFSGKIYSIGFDNVHHCVYYNGFFTKQILFAIPVHGCGTRATQNTREMIDYVENRVHVQIDKYTLSTYDKKYAFVCELAPPAPAPAFHPFSQSVSNTVGVEEPGSAREIRRHPSLPSAIVPSNSRDHSPFTSPFNMPIKRIIPENLPSAYGKQIVPNSVSYGGGIDEGTRRSTLLIPMLPDPFNAKDHIALDGISGKTTGMPMSRHSVPPDPFASDDDAHFGSPASSHPTRRTLAPKKEGFITEKELNELNSGSLNYNEINKGYKDQEQSQGSTRTSVRTTATSTPSTPAIQPTPFTYSTHSPPSSPTTPHRDSWSTVPLFDSSRIELDTTGVTATGFFNSSRQQTRPKSKPVRMYANQQIKPSISSATVSSISTHGNSTDSSMDKSIFLEIKRGNHPSNSSRVHGGSVKIGEPIILVIHGKAATKDRNQFNIFVHSCHSSDGTEDNHIQLIDNAGCAAHPQVLGGMQRVRTAASPPGVGRSVEDEILYFFAMKAFKFPTRNDVYFFCSVDIAADYNFPEVCPKKKARREAPSPTTNQPPDPFDTSSSITGLLADIHELMVYDNFSVASLPDGVSGEDTMMWKKVKGERAVEAPGSKMWMRESRGRASALTLTLALMAAAALSVALILLYLYRDVVLRAARKMAKAVKIACR